MSQNGYGRMMMTMPMRMANDDDDDDDDDAADDDDDDDDRSQYQDLFDRSL